MAQTFNDINKALEYARQFGLAHLKMLLLERCKFLVNDALQKQKGYRNFTGSTITSIACGLYYNGKLESIVTSLDSGIKSAVRDKLRKGEYVLLTPDYDGSNRKFTGTIDTDGGSGVQFSIDFLHSFVPNVRNGFEIVMTTGTEYSTYLEFSRQCNILSDTKDDVARIITSNIRKI